MRQVIVLDALDACADVKELIQKVIVERWVSELPFWLCLAVSTRPDPQFVRMLFDFQVVVLNERVHRQQQPVMRVERAKELLRVKVYGDGELATKSEARAQRQNGIAEDLAIVKLPASLQVFIIHARGDGDVAHLLRDALQPCAERSILMSDGSEDGLLSALFEADPTGEVVVLVFVSEAMQAETLRGKNGAFKEASRLLPAALLPVVVDASMLTQKSWTGDLSLALGNELYVDFHEPAEMDGAKIARAVLNKHEGRRGAHDWDVFISHEWGVHDVAKDLALRLERDHGLKVWLDETEMRGKMNEAMAEGIGRSRVFLILATARYLEKVNSGDGDENCCKEFTYASAQAHPTVVAALEPAMLRVTARSIDGNTFNVDLGNAPVVDLTGGDTEASMRRLVCAIKERQTANSDDYTLPKGIRELRARLGPLDSTRWARQKADAFSPGTRRWILDFVQDWYETSDERVIVVQGDGGVGKSTVLADICRRGDALGDTASPGSQKRPSFHRRLWRRNGPEAASIPIAAIHFFRHDRNADKSAVTALRSIAWELCNKLPGFAAALEEELMAKTSDELQALEDVFEIVLAAPAAKVAQIHPPRTRQVVVLDALDECDNAAEFIQKIIVQRWTSKLPSWLCLLVSTRPEAQIPEMMQGFRARKIEVSDDNNIADMRLHLRRIMRDEVVESEVDAVADELTERSEGLFLWVSFLPDTLRRLRREMGVGRDTLLRRQDVVGEKWFPSGLGGMFRKYFARFRDEAMGGKDRYELLLAPIVAAREPLPRDILHAALGEPMMRATEQLIRKGRNLLYQTGSGGVGLLHKSMADWLTDADQDEDFYVDKEKGDTLLAGVLLQRQDDPFSITHIVYHLIRSGDETSAFALLNDFGWVQQAVSRGEDQEQRRRAIGDLLRDCAELGITFARETDTLQLLSKSLKALSWDPNELASQVLARLRVREDDQDHPLIKTFCEPQGPWLQSLRPTLPHPHDPLQQVLEGHSGGVTSVAVEGDRVVSGSWDKTIRVWSAATGALQHVLEGHSGAVWCVAMEDDRVVSGSDDNTVRIWNAVNGALQHVLEGHSRAVWCVAIEGDRLVSGSWDKTIGIWNASTGALQHMIKSRSGAVQSVAVEGERVVSGSEGKVVCIYNAVTGALQRVLRGHSNQVSSVAVEGDRVVSGSRDKTIRVWDAATGALQHVLESGSGEVESVAIKGDRVVSGSKEKTVHIYDAASGVLQHVLRGHTSNVSGVAIEGDRVLSAGDLTVRVWNTATDALQHELGGHSATVTSLAVEGDRVVSGSDDSTVRIWNAATGALQHVLEGHSSEVKSVAIKGDRVVSGSWDYTVRIWDAATGALLHILRGHFESILSVAVEGDRVVSKAWKGEVCVWDLDTGRALDRRDLPSLQVHPSESVLNRPWIGAHVQLVDGTGFTSEYGVRTTARAGDVIVVGDLGGMVHFLRERKGCEYV